MSLRALRAIRAREPEPKPPTAIGERRAAMREALRDDLFLFPWKWLDLTHERWMEASFEERVKLW